jgi:hypothetical protein
VGEFCKEFGRLTHNAQLVGAVISFDADRLWRLLTANGVQPSWHYHIVDVEALVVGYLRGLYAFAGNNLAIDLPIEAHGKTYTTVSEITTHPWDSAALSKAVGVDPADFDRHTAAGDVLWARALHDAVMGNVFRAVRLTFPPTTGVGD